MKYIKAESQETVWHSKGAMHNRGQMDIDGNIIFQSPIMIKKTKKRKYPSLLHSVCRGLVTLL